MRVCYREKIPFVARGSGTGLSGGALPVANGIVISLARMNRILEVDIPNQRVVVEPGVMNAERDRAVSRPMDISTRPILPRSKCARSAATWRKTQAAHTA